MEEQFAVDETEWDAASRSEEVNEDARGICPECGDPLVRVAENIACAPVSCCLTALRVGSTCSRSDRRILPGELHFECRECGAVVCKEEGPGVVVDRDYDFLDRATGELQVRTLHKGILHSRKLKVRSGGGVCASDQDYDTASRVVNNMRSLCKKVGAETTEVLDKDWPGDYCQVLFGASSGQELCRVFKSLSLGALQTVQQEETLTNAAPPCKVFGDIHGQLRDMMLLFSSYGIPGDDGPSFVFNGDFVDRGEHQLEVLGILMALKICFPKKVFLNRGNHEDEVVNRRYGFYKECTMKFSPEGEAMFQGIVQFFDHLPLACLIGERILVVHGGIGDGTWTLDDLREVKRPLNHEQLQAERDFVYNILWSDPIEEDSSGSTFGVHSSGRGKMARTFGWNVTQAFCERNDLDMIVRSHQAKSRGFGFDVMHDEALVRVFSARDYENNRNDGAILQITPSDGDEEDDALLVIRAQVIRSLTKS